MITTLFTDHIENFLTGTAVPDNWFDFCYLECDLDVITDFNETLSLLKKKIKKGGTLFGSNYDFEPIVQRGIKLTLGDPDIVLWSGYWVKVV